MISIEHLYFSYTGAAPFILEDISLSVDRGEYISILGENGTGKSTLVKLMLHLLKPSSGTVTVRTKNIGYVPQKMDFLNTQFPITVSEMLGSYRRLLKLKDRHAVEKSLALVKMESFRNALIGTLSGGQAQKVFIARAMMGEPELLVLDEPSTGVDRGSQKEIYALIRQMNREKGITVVSIEHNLEAAIGNSTLIYHLSGAKGHLCSPDQYIAEYVHSSRGGDENDHDAQL